MTKGRVLRSAGVALMAAALAGWHTNTSAQPAGLGIIRGQVHLTGKPPGNAIVRMGVDPMCATVNAGKRVLQEAVMTTPDGDLANVFVSLQGKFPAVAVPSEPVTIDQRGCVYVPRMAGARVGQTLQVRNSDPLLHNVHTVSTAGNEFNVGQPVAGMVYQFRLKGEETVLRLKCDIHRWMTAYVGVVTHPYFAVTGRAGMFEIKNVPAGNYTIRAWHERYGEVSQSVSVKPGTTTTLNLAYSGTEKAPTAGVQDLSVPSGLQGSMHAALIPLSGQPSAHP